MNDITNSLRVVRGAKLGTDTGQILGRGRSLELKGLQKTYSQIGEKDSFVAIQDLSLEVAAGEFVSIIGESGCGKSTLFRMIAGLESPSNGKVLFRGEEVR